MQLVTFQMPETANAESQRDEGERMDEGSREYSITGAPEQQKPSSDESDGQPDGERDAELEREAARQALLKVKLAKHTTLHYIRINVLKCATRWSKLWRSTRTRGSLRTWRC